MTSLSSSIKDRIGTTFFNISNYVEGLSRSVQELSRKVKDSIGTALFNISRFFDTLNIKDTKDSIVTALFNRSRPVETLSLKDRIATALFNKSRPAEVDSKVQLANDRNAQINRFKQHAAELVEAIESFDNSSLPGEKNKGCTAKKRYDEAVKTFAEDLKSLDGKVSRKEFIEIIKKDSSVRIFANSRYGSAFENKGEISLGRFIAILLNSKSRAIRSAYKKEIKEVANKLAISLENVKNDQDVNKFNADRFEAIDKLAENNAYANVIAKSKEAIAEDLNNAIIAELGGKQEIESSFKFIESLIQSPVYFAETIKSDRSQIEKEFAAEIELLEKNISNFDALLRHLLEAEKVYEKETQTLLDQVNSSTKEKCDARRAEVAEEVARIAVERKGYEAEKQETAKKISDLKEQLPRAIELLRLALLGGLNAEKRELGRLIGMDFADIQVLPKEAASQSQKGLAAKLAEMVGLPKLWSGSKTIY